MNIKTITLAIIAASSIFSYSDYVAFLEKNTANGSPNYQQETIKQFSANSKNFVELGGGYYHSIAVDSSGNLWATGSNFKGQLGHREYDTIDSIFMMDIDNVKKVSRNGQLHTLILKNNGLLYAAGHNSVGQLGTGNTTQLNSWTHIDIRESGTPVLFKEVYAGYAQSFALDYDGNIWVTGGNTYGELGINGSSDLNIFTKINTLSDIKAIETGNNHSTALDIHGKVYTVGRNTFGMIGNGSTGTKVETWYENPTLSNITQIEGGLYHTLALDSSGNLWATGRNHKGQLGVGNTSDNHSFSIVANNVSKIRAGGFFTTIIDNLGDIYSAGHNNGGQLGIDNYDDKLNWTKIPFIEAKVVE